MNHGWNKKKLGELTDFKYGYPFDSKKFNMDCNGMPLIRIRDVVPGRTSTYYDGEFSDEYIIKSGDYLIGMDGEFNIARWNSYEALLNQRVCKVMSADNNVMLNQFLYFFLKIELKRIEEHTPFVTVKHLSAKTLNNIIIPIPPLNIQNKLVSELDKINELIGVKRSQLKDLDALAQSLFYETFGEPIDNPKGWETEKFGNICELSAGGDKPADTQKEMNAERNIPVYSNGIDNEGLYGYTSEPRITKPSLTISGRGTLGVPFIRKTPYVPIIRLIVAIPTSVVNLSFLYYLVKIMKFGGKGAAIPQLTVPMVKDVVLPVPPLALQEQFAERIEAIEEQKRRVEASIADLETLLASRMDYWFND